MKYHKLRWAAPGAIKEIAPFRWGYPGICPGTVSENPSQITVPGHTPALLSMKDPLLLNYGYRL